MQGGNNGQEMHQTFRFRPVEDQDLTLVASWPQSREELFFFHPRASFPLTVSQLAEAIAQRSDSTVAVADSQVVGFANFYRWETNGHCVIGNVIVAPGSRSHGVASALIDHMIILALSKHRAAEVRIACFHRNLAGLLLYSKLKFSPFAIEERRDWQNERVALVHFRRPCA